MLHCLVPGIHERLRSHRSAIRELGIALNLNSPVLVVVRLDRFGNFHLGVAFGIVVFQTGKDVVQNQTAAGFISVSGNQRVLGLGIVTDNYRIGICFAFSASAVRARSASSHRQCQSCRSSDGSQLLLHEVSLQRFPQLGAVYQRRRRHFRVIPLLWHLASLHSKPKFN
ncbi:Uncharacterised protein [Mobiluncus curtisii]|uniref:Uncharacterized protein n=1 Tax=Mobiluncus curtisii TaxID=2051 RepID=A0A2X3BJ13_9ACTO|nr:Uncharacterised protein [Mobiluncus curtisii]